MTIVERAAVVVIALALLSSSGLAHQSFEKAGDNLLNIITPPTDPLTRQVVARLQASMVPTPNDAKRFAISWPGVRYGDARDRMDVTGLYLFAHNVRGFAKSDDLIWEVRVFRFGHVSQLMWVEAATGTVKVLFAPEQ